MIDGIRIQMTHPLSKMAFSILEILTNKNHSKILSEVKILLELEFQGFDIEESYQCITLLKDHGFLYCPFVGKIALT